MRPPEKSQRPTGRPRLFDEARMQGLLDELSTEPAPTARNGERPKLLSIVVPTYNEEAVLEAFERRVADVMDRISQPHEMLFVNDGSEDGTLDVLCRLREQNPSVSVLNLSRNFGKEIALTAGLDHAAGDVVAVIDADLQDPPEVIPELLAKWREGYDAVYAVRTERQGETMAKRKTAEWFYRVMQHLGPVTIPPNAGDFRLMSRRFVDALTAVREQHRFMKGLYAWVGFPQTAVPYKRDPRFAGTSKWSYWKLWNLSLEGITAFTTIPLRASTYLGLVVAALAFLYGLTIIAKTIFFGEVVQGFATIITAILFLGGVQLMALGVIGEYLGRVFNETKKRPLYFVERNLPSRSSGRLAEGTKPPRARIGTGIEAATPSVTKAL